MKRTDRKLRDIDLVDSLLGDAPGLANGAGETGDHERSAFWRGLLGAAKTPDTTRDLHERIVEDTLDRAHEWRDHTARPADRPGWRFRPGLATAAALAILLAGIAVPIAMRAGEHTPADPDRSPAIAAAPSPSATERHVNFNAPRPGDGTPDAPYNSIARAVEDAPEQGVVVVAGGLTPETLKVDKPMRIEAVNGSVQIGASL